MFKKLIFSGAIVMVLTTGCQIPEDELPWEVWTVTAVEYDSPTDPSTDGGTLRVFFDGRDYGYEPFNEYRYREFADDGEEFFGDLFLIDGVPMSVLWPDAISTDYRNFIEMTLLQPPELVEPDDRPLRFTVDAGRIFYLGSTEGGLFTPPFAIYYRVVFTAADEPIEFNE